MHAETAELRRDLASLDPSPYMERALDEIVDSVLRGQPVKCGRFRLTILDALYAVQEDDMYDFVARLITADRSLKLELLDVFVGKLERDLRDKWMDGSAVQEKAVEMMREEA
jgi:hypothetical protein